MFWRGTLISKFTFAWLPDARRNSRPHFDMVLSVGVTSEWGSVPITARHTVIQMATQAGFPNYRLARSNGFLKSSS